MSDDVVVNVDAIIYSSAIVGGKGHTIVDMASTSSASDILAESFTSWAMFARTTP